LTKLNHSSRFFWVKRHLDDPSSALLHQQKIPGLSFMSESQRNYPSAMLAANVLGFTNFDGKGAEGLDFLYEKLLKGEEGKLIAQRDAKGRKVIVGGIEKFGHPGKHLITTIDSVLQYLTERELSRALQETHAVGASGIMMNPRSGEILAMAMRPTFDPN